MTGAVCACGCGASLVGKQRRYASLQCSGRARWGGLRTPEARTAHVAALRAAWQRWREGRTTDMRQRGLRQRLARWEAMTDGALQQLCAHTVLAEASPVERRAARLVLTRLIEDSYRQGYEAGRKATRRQEVA